MRNLRRVVLVGLVGVLLSGRGCGHQPEGEADRTSDTESAVERVIQWEGTESGYRGRTIIHDNGSSRDEP